MGATENLSNASGCDFRNGRLRAAGARLPFRIPHPASRISHPASNMRQACLNSQRRDPGFDGCAQRANDANGMLAVTAKGRGYQEIVMTNQREQNQNPQQNFGQQNQGNQNQKQQPGQQNQEQGQPRKAPGQGNDEEE